MDGLIIIFILVILGIVIMVVGHVAWLAAAWFLRAVFGMQPKSANPERQCPSCAGEMKWLDTTCSLCGAQVGSDTGRAWALQTLNNIGARVAWLQSEGRITDSSAAEIQRALSEEQASLEGRPIERAVVPPPQPVIPIKVATTTHHPNRLITRGLP